jgi:hypothetical protein
MSLAQIGEFAFVLLSRASSIHLIEVIFLILSSIFCVMPHTRAMVVLTI